MAARLPLSTTLELTFPWGTTRPSRRCDMSVTEPAEPRERLNLLESWLYTFRASCDELVVDAG